MEDQSMLVYQYQHLYRPKKPSGEGGWFFTGPSKTPLLGGLSAFQIGSY